MNNKTLITLYYYDIEVEKENVLIVLFFYFKGNIVYEITGDNIAKNYFTVDRVNGEIRASQNLKDDPLKSTQYNVSYQRIPVLK